MHADTGLLAVMGSVCMMLALVLAWCLAGVRSSPVRQEVLSPSSVFAEGAPGLPDDDRASVRLLRDGS
jgi:hypothetical protein